MNPHYRYVVVSIFVFLCCLVLGLFLSENDFVWRHTATVQDGLLDRRFSVADIDADVLFVGDSSLLFGVMPERIESKTGLTSYNLATSVWGFVAAADAITDEYLEKNHPPRLIVLYLAPWVRVNPPYSYKMEWNIAARMVLSHGRVADLLRFFELHPAAFLPFEQDVWSRLFFGFHLRGDTIENAVKALQKGRGWLSAEDPVVPVWTHLQDNCAKPQFAIAPDTAYIEHFRQRMRARGLPVAFYVSPIPDCDPSDTAAQTAYRGIADNEIYQLPHRYFVDDGYYAHLFRRGSEQNTDKVAEWVLQRIGPGGLMQNEAQHLNVESPAPVEANN